MALGSPGE